MTEQELSAQRKKARAKLELLQMKRRSGLVSQADVDEFQRIYDALVNYQRPPEPMTEPEPLPPVGPVISPSEFTQLLEKLTLENAEAHRHMCIRSNQLGTIPDHVNAKALVDEIQHYKAIRNELRVKINYLKANGCLPAQTPEPTTEQQQSEFLDSLPTEKYELAKLLKDSILPNLSKARGKLARATDPTKKAHYSQKVAKLEVEASMVRSRMNAL